MYELQLLLTNNWKKITDQVYTPPKSFTVTEWGATLIQSDRYDIRLNFENEATPQAGTYCWHVLNCGQLTRDPIFVTG